MLKGMVRGSLADHVPFERRLKRGEKLVVPSDKGSRNILLSTFEKQSQCRWGGVNKEQGEEREAEGKVRGALVSFEKSRLFNSECDGCQAKQG